MTPAEKTAALENLMWLVEPLMPIWSNIQPRDGERLHVTVHLEGVRKLLGRTIEIRFGERLLERYMAMSDEQRHVMDASIRSVIDAGMRTYEDGYTARKDTVLEPHVVDVSKGIRLD